MTEKLGRDIIDIVVIIISTVDIMTIAIIIISSISFHSSVVRV